MSSPASGSESASFGRLHPLVQQWIWAQGWTALRDAQEQAIPALLDADRDVIVAASTAAGKTEAAFLPILTHLLKGETLDGAVLYISPLKALINDQWERLGRLCERLEIAVVGWHGDVAASRKQRFLKSPNGILLITPESLEALFVNRGSAVTGLFARLRYIVVDELHAFIGSERGKQLQSLMQRVEQAAGKPLARVGLSATLGDMALAREFLRPGQGRPMEVVQSAATGVHLQIQVRGYIAQPMHNPPTHMLAQADADQAADDTDLQEGEVSRFAIAEHLFRVLRGSNNLIFPNSRGLVEWYADRLRQLCENAGLANEFLPHHGNLSRELREDTERALKAGSPPASAVCTTTLELGMDIGTIKAVAQIGAPPSVASLRQRLGRSGRREGEAAILRGYCQENLLKTDSSLSDRLRQSLVQTIAMIRLLVENWYEPPRSQGLHASTLVQQCLSVIAQRGGASAAQLWSELVASGSFANIGKTDFMALLKSLGEHDLIVQDSSGLLLAGEKGERLVNHYEFYSAFTSAEEFRLIRDGRPLGSLPVEQPLTLGQCIIFGGKRWQVLDVDLERKVIVVKPARAGAPVQFDTLGGMRVHERVRQEMRAVLMDDRPCPFLDASAQALLTEARQTFQALELHRRTIIDMGSRCAILPWAGDYTLDALCLMLERASVDCEHAGLVLEVEVPRQRLLEALHEVASMDAMNVEGLLAGVKNLIQEKWDWALPEPLLIKSFAASRLDLPEAIRLAGELAAGC